MTIDNKTELFKQQVAQIKKIISPSKQTGVIKGFIQRSTYPPVIFDTQDVNRSDSDETLTIFAVQYVDIVYNDITIKLHNNKDAPSGTYPIPVSPDGGPYATVYFGVGQDEQFYYADGGTLVIQKHVSGKINGNVTFTGPYTYTGSLTFDV
ncbi:hypothetical protein ABH912_005707 [Pseudomonas sp. BT76 TE3572]|uniref:Uncharacterized protein n=1 Tax=Pseudomonas mandelii PD30 TaxID=1419583 RepID=A0A059L562_9PSED|nr:hypothetical protein [Pseudomonas mandelii]KDD69468.1 hypothetical protein V466_08290 [Pseudomonas mandelii PD30]